MSLNYNGKYGTIEDNPQMPDNERYVAQPADGRKSKGFPTAHHAMDYLKAKNEETKRNSDGGRH